MIKLIACDMDGTLLNGEGKLGEEFFEVFEKLMKRGIKFVVASGRQYYTLLNGFENVGDKLFYIAENGTLVKYNNEELHLDTLSKDDVDAVVRFGLEKKDVYLVVCGKKCAYINSRDDIILNEVKKYYHRYEVVDNFFDIDDEVLKVAVFDVNGAEENSYPSFNKEFKDRLQVIVSGKVWLDLYNKSASKGIAIELLQEKYNINKDETMVFGDYFNDIDMFKSAYYSYAMGNAPDEVKKHAKFLAKSNEENGVINVIKEMVLKD